MKLRYFGLLLFFPLLAGCSGSGKLPDITRYDLYKPTETKKITKLQEEFYVLTLAFFEHRGLIVVPLDIQNKTGQEITAEEYSFELTDGRDHLPLKLITRSELEVIRQKMSGSKNGFDLMNPSVQGAFNALDSLVSFPANSILSGQLENAIKSYFSLRPIYAHETRKGFLAFYHDFELEYPLLLSVKLKDELIELYFKPQPAAAK
jgi:hypothetical protein